jgi:hypothetical protein
MKNKKNEAGYEGFHAEASREKISREKIFCGGFP